MAGSFYFLCSSFAYLRFGEAPPCDSASFLDTCEAHVSAGQYQILSAAALLPSDSAGCPAEAAWNAWETALRNHVAKVRALRAGADPSVWVRETGDSFSGLEKAVGDAFANRNPQASEEALDKLRWQALSDLETGREFSFDFVFLYRVKLLILEKWASFDVSAGRQALDTFLETKLTSFQLPEFADAS